MSIPNNATVIEGNYDMKWYHKIRNLPVAAAVAATVGTPLSQAEAQDAGRLVFITTGGNYQKMQEETVFGPFSEETGIEVVFVTATDAEKWPKIQGMSQVGNMQWDLIESQPADYHIPSKAQYLVDFGENCALVPGAFEDGIEGVCSQFGVLPIVGATLLAANTTMFPEGGSPANWADFWNVEDFPGPRSLQNFGTPWRVIVGALVADGVPKDQLFPLDLDRAFAKLDKIKPHVALWWSAGDQIQRAMREGEIAVGQIWATRLSFLQEEGVPIAPIWDGATLNEGRWSILKDAPNSENAGKFLNWFYANPQAQFNYAKAVKAVPVTRSAIALYPDGEETVDFDAVIPIDYKWLGENEPAILERWNTWIAG